MKKKTKIIRITCILVVAGYIGCCLRGFHLKPELVIDSTVSSDSHTSLRKWYSQLEEDIRPTLSKDSLLYALSHPYRPTEAKCYMYYDRSHNCIQVVASGGSDYWTNLVESEGKWVVTVIRTNK